MLKQVMAATLMAATAGVSVGAVTTIQPDEDASQDTFVYQFSIFANSPGTLVPGGSTGSVFAVNKSNAGHDMRSLIKFDLAGVTLDPGETAYLRLYVRPTLNPAASAEPSSTNLVTVNAYAASTAWDEATATWNNQPETGAFLASSIVTGINQWISFDITDQVESWLANPSSNYGFVLTQDQRVYDPVAQLEVGVFFRGAGYTTASERPMLEVVPEPASLAIVGLAGATLLRRRRA